MRALYDVSVLIALLDENHKAHDSALKWALDNAGQGWASCPITQNGCLRILSQSKYQNPLSFAEALGRLISAVSTPHHQFFTDDISLLDETMISHPSISSHSELTDVYLLALAVAHGARFVTLDTHIPRSAVMGATPEHLVEIQSL